MTLGLERATSSCGSSTRLGHARKYVGGRVERGEHEDAVGAVEALDHQRVIASTNKKRRKEWSDGVI